MKIGLNTEAPSPGIQIVAHTVSHNGAADKKFKFPSTSLTLSLQVILRVDEKNMQAQK